MAHELKGIFKVPRSQIETAEYILVSVIDGLRNLSYLGDAGAGEALNALVMQDKGLARLFTEGKLAENLGYTHTWSKNKAVTDIGSGKGETRIWIAINPRLDIVEEVSIRNENKVYKLITLN